MGLPVLIFAVIAVVLVGAGIGAGLFACGIAAVLVIMGVVSSSAALGFLTRRPAVALRVFLLQCGLFAGLPAGAVTAWLGHTIIETLASVPPPPATAFNWPILLMGAAGGAVAGIALAFVLDFILRRAHALLTAPLQSRSGT